jgi:hypothetical protein
MGKYEVQRYGARFFSVWLGAQLVCVTVYKRGAEEVAARLNALSGRSAA